MQKTKHMVNFSICDIFMNSCDFVFEHMFPIGNFLFMMHPSHSNADD